MRPIATTFIKTLLLFSLFLIVKDVFSQSKLTGSQYVLNTDSYISFKYDREYKKVGDNYLTIYKIYNPTKGDHAFTIKATHSKSSKKVKVDIEEAGGGFLAHINSEETTYETQSLEPFGFRGTAGTLGGKRVPNQLMVKFVNNKYESIKVVHVNATEPGSNNFYWYILDEKN